MRTPAPLALLLALTGCAAPGWHQAGTSPEQLKRDKGECQALAHERVARPTPAVPPVSLDRRFGGHVEGPIPPTETRLREQQALDACMRERGYRLEPAAR